jgi:chromosome segregation ATPase
MSGAAAEAPRTGAAIQARRAVTDQMLQRISQVLRQMRRERAQVTVAAVARRAAVSRTFLYQNAEARALIAAAGHGGGTATRQDAGPDPAEASWRERALNAEHQLKRAHEEIATQRKQIGELLGRIRDLEHDLPSDGVRRVLTENHTLRAQLRQLTQDNRRLGERLTGARDNNRFLDKRIANLEAQLAEGQCPRCLAAVPQTSPSPGN